MKLIFNKEDFCLCDVPVPKGYPQSQTHCGVAFIGDIILMTTSPYPNYKRNKYVIYFWAILKKISFGVIGSSKIFRGEDYENPCLYIERKRKDGVVIPNSFELIEGSPLMNKPFDKFGLGSYCSDPDVYVEGDTVYVLNRTTIRKARTGSPKLDYETCIHLISCKIENNTIVDKVVTDLWKGFDVSPCICRYNGAYLYTSLITNSFNDGKDFDTLNIRTSDNIYKGWSDEKSVRVVSEKYVPWHMSLFEHKGTLYSIIACVEKGIANRCWTMLGEFSRNLNELKIYQTPLTDFKSYRSSALVTKNGIFVLYNSVVNEPIEGGNAVDGREIVVASKDFEKLLAELRSE